MAKSLFEDIFGPGPFSGPPEPEINPDYLRAIRAAANAWLKEHPQHPQAGLVKVALMATNPKK